MSKIKQLCRSLIEQRWFELLIISVILVNSALIGVETYFVTKGILLVQHIILGIFTFEIVVRFIARDSTKSFFRSGWNLFDLTLVLVSYVPESLFEGSTMIMAVRILRVFRVLRLLRTSEEIKLIIAVLSKSFSALFYNGVFFFIFIYLFSIIGVSLFKLPDYESLDAEGKAKYTELMQVAPHAPECSPDPYGTLSESMFTLFRALTGEDWTDLRYNLIKANEYGLIHTSPIAITSFHVVWFVLAAFLLLNLVVGAIVNNYQVIMEESRRAKERERKDKGLEELDAVE
ncbi:ion transporter [Dysgonomonas sp. 25]|uniref:ion transporter n=1 Tax=Dysgonomonas sp. 25 TaxID=2302933 RepID=UPI0013D35CF0|nr:ion transporter [Dysgonomonas sp. 25]NDV69417.1 ion transporter [Dysgonomonas sp. 25]